jgi:L,D-transpeptidase YcbB
MMSHGCVRVENPRALAVLLLAESPQAIDQAIDTDRTHRQLLPKPLPVFIVYRTAFVEPGGSIGFRADPYRRDDRIWQYLIRSHQLPIAQGAMSSQRKG